MRTNNRLRKRYLNELRHQCQADIAKISTFNQRRKAVNYYINFLNQSNVNLKQITSSDLRKFLQYLSQKQTRFGKKFASATVKQIYALVRSFYVYCFEENLVITHPDHIFKKGSLRRYKLGEQKLPSRFFS